MILQFHSGLKDLCWTPVYNCTLKRMWTYRRGFRKQQLKFPERNWSFFTSQMEEGAFKRNIQARTLVAGRFQSLFNLKPSDRYLLEIKYIVCIVCFWNEVEKYNFVRSLEEDLEMVLLINLQLTVVHHFQKQSTKVVAFRKLFVKILQTHTEPGVWRCVFAVQHTWRDTGCMWLEGDTEGNAHRRRDSLQSPTQQH